jgi:hypothetical protein
MTGPQRGFEQRHGLLVAEHSHAVDGRPSQYGDGEAVDPHDIAYRHRLS